MKIWDDYDLESGYSNVGTFIMKQYVWAPTLTAWNYRKIISVNNTGAQQTDYQIAVTETDVDLATILSESKMETDILIFSE